MWFRFGFCEHHTFGQGLFSIVRVLTKSTQIFLQLNLFSSQKKFPHLPEQETKLA